MCNPVMIAAGAGAAVNTVSAYNQAKANNIAAEHNARIMENNAELARQKADIAKEKGEAEQARHRLKISKLKGTQRAGFAGSGVVIDSGSALDVLQDTVATEELDALQIKQNASMEVWSNMAAADNFKARADLSRSQKSSPFLAAFGAASSSAPTVLGAARAS